MISRGKRYKLDNNHIQFVEEKRNSKSKIRSAFRFFIASTGLSLVLIVLFTTLVGSPVEIYLNYRSNTYKGQYLQLNKDIDSLQQMLHAKLFASDNFYRQVLELDSVPEPVRFAGTGGASPYDSLNHYHYKDLISALLTKVMVVNKQLEVHEKSSGQVFKEAINHSLSMTGIPAIQPVKPSKKIWLSSVYGYRKDPISGIRKMHYGLDFAGVTNTKIFATADGFVTKTKESRRGYGKEVVLLHSFGYKTRYAHLNKILVVEGDTIKRGDLIGLMGNTGKSTGTHLHYEVILNNKPINPFYYFANDFTEEEYQLLTNKNKDE